MSVFNQYYNWYQIAHQILVKLDLTNVVAIKRDPEFDGGSLFAGFIPVNKANQEFAEKMKLLNQCNNNNMNKVFN